MNDVYTLPFQQTLIELVELALEEVLHGSTSKGILLIGESGTGKSTALDILVECIQALPLLAINSSPHQQLMPVCRVQSDLKADAASILKLMLTNLGKPQRPGMRATVAQLEADAMSALSARRVRLLIFEEFHNTLLSGSRQLRGQASLLLKNIWNSVPRDRVANWTRPGSADNTRLVIVVSGTEELLPVFEQDAELASRFCFKVMAPRIRMYPLTEFQLFRQVARSMCRRYGLDSYIDVATDDTMAVRLYFATEAHLRKLNSLLERCKTLRKQKKYQGVPALDFMREVYSENFLKREGESSNPFAWDESEVARRASLRMESIKRLDRK